MHTREATRAKRVILEIIRQAGGTFTGKTRLYKAFYLAHLFYAEGHRGYLTEWPIVKMPNGPGIDAGAELLQELVVTGQLAREPGHVGPYPTTTYRYKGLNDGTEVLSEASRQAIGSAVKFVSQRTATELSDLTHEFSRSWLEAKEGQPLNIYIDLIPEEQYDKRRKRLNALNEDLLAAWSET